MKKFFAAAAIAAVAAMALAATASAAVPRYQVTNATLTAYETYGSSQWTHVYTIAISPCDGSYTGTGVIQSSDGYNGTLETVTGQYHGASNFVFDAIYTSGPTIGGTLQYVGPFAGGDTLLSTPPGIDVSVAFTLTNVTRSDYANHGDYVSKTGGGSDAAHSCIGMPLPHSWSASGTIDSSSATGTTITLPDAATGIYMIQVSGTWQNGPWWLVDAEYVQQGANGGGTWDGIVGDQGVPNGALTWLQGWPGLGADFGDVLVNGTGVDWGAYSSSHTYSLVMPLSGSVTLAMNVNDTLYTDNVGSLNYTITYLQP